MGKTKYPLIRFTSNRTLEEAERIFAARISDARMIWKKYNATFVNRVCPICGSAASEPADSFYDTFTVEICIICNTPFVNPAPGEEALQYYYQNGTSIKIVNQLLKKRSKDNKHFIVDDRLKVVLDQIALIKPGYQALNILEIGCNQGSFLSNLRLKLLQRYPLYKFNLTGIDIDKEALSLNNDPDITLLQESAESLTNKLQWLDHFDLIICFELIEHLVDPSDFMNNVRKILKNEGTLILTTPNYEGLEIKAASYNNYRLLSHTVFPPFHLNSFSTFNFTHFSLRNRFAIVRIETPGKLDVDLVSLYSRNSSTVEEVFCEIDLLDEKMKGWLQALITKLKVSSNMLVVLKKNNQI